MSVEQISLQTNKQKKKKKKKKKEGHGLISLTWVILSEKVAWVNIVFLFFF